MRTVIQIVKEQQKYDNILFYKKNIFNTNYQRAKTFSKDELPIERKGIVPNHEVVRRLTDVVSDNNFYIKRVIEDPPRTSKASAHIMNYYWDIAGRVYKGLYPIDFHIVISGEENYLKPPLSKTKIDIIVKGSVTDKDVQDQVEYTGERLVGIMEDVLEQLPRMTIENTFEEQEKFGATEEQERRKSESEQTAQPEDRITELYSHLDRLDSLYLSIQTEHQKCKEIINNLLK
ncbi:MAG: hypothetical protein GY804_06990 [Alphaproteobacteria bacterium]|nr:hypothetical protein [Alphaproteobacteria bacterium]